MSANSGHHSPHEGSSSSLPRVLGVTTATAIVVGTVIGSGVFKKPQAIAEAVPYSGVVLLVWVVGGLLTLLGALAYAEVAALFPRTGGNYVFLREAYGRLAGFLWGWVEFWIIRSASLAALATIFAESVAELVANDSVQRLFGLPNGTNLAAWGQRLLTIGVLLGLGLVNIRGVRLGGGLQVIVTLVKVGSLLAIALVPWLFLTWPDSLSSSRLPSVDHLHPIWPTTPGGLTLSGLATAFLSVLWAYHGWMNLAPIAGEVRNPQRNLPLALLLGVGLLVLLYCSVNLAYYLVLSGSEMAGFKDRPVAAVFALELLGPLGGAAVSAAILLSVFGSLNGNLLVGPRLLVAMGEDRLAPTTLASIHVVYRTPAVAIGVFAIWASLQVLAVAILTDLKALTTTSPFDLLTNFAMFGAVIFETLAVLAIFRFRQLLPNAERVYRCPGYPWVPALYVLLPGFVLLNMFTAQPIEALTGVGFILLGALLYFTLGLNRRAGCCDR